MAVTTATSQTSSISPATAPMKSTKLDYEAFLKLLVTQMRNQDPTKPMDSTEYIAQLASFSNVEQAVGTNKKLDELIQMTRLSQGSALVDKYITSLDTNDGGWVKSVRFTDAGIVALLSSGNEMVVNDRVRVQNEPG